MIDLAEPQWHKIEFPVSLEQIYTGQHYDAKPISGARAVVREDTQDVLGIVSKRYQIVSHGEVFRPLNDLVRQLPDFPVKRVTTRAGDRGAVAQVEWEFEHLVEVVEGDSVSLSLIAKNSMNKSASVCLTLAARRLICSNGLRGPGPQYRKRNRHVGNFNITASVRWAETLLKRRDQMFDEWRKWANTRIYGARLREFLETDRQAQNVLGKRDRTALSSRLGSLTETPTVRLWDAYNVITEHATHTVKVRRTDLLLLRQEQVQNLALRFVRWAQTN